MDNRAMSLLLHRAFVYGSPDEFVECMAPFARDGVECGDVVFAATKPANIAAMREALGADAARVEFHDTQEWCVLPYERLQAFKRMADSVPPGARLRAMGEPVWNGSRSVRRQWVDYESIINLALADAAMEFVCLYDGAALPERILRRARHTHPERLDDGAAVRCDDFIPPERFTVGDPPAPPDSAVELPVDGRSFRRAVEREALDAGLSAPRAQDLVLAAHEVAANALGHGRAPVRAHLWTDAGELVCQVRDRGPGVANRLAGWLPPERAVAGGWGLAIARQLCDGLEIAREGRETVVTLAASL